MRKGGRRRRKHGKDSLTTTMMVMVMTVEGIDAHDGQSPVPGQRING